MNAEQYAVVSEYDCGKDPDEADGFTWGDTLEEAMQMWTPGDRVFKREVSEWVEVDVTPPAPPTAEEAWGKGFDAGVAAARTANENAESCCDNFDLHLDLHLEGLRHRTDA